jgi:Golgi nucleoside diphosphatase
MVVDGERVRMNNDNKYFTYKDALFAAAVLCITFIMQLVQFERLENKVKELEKKVMINE